MDGRPWWGPRHFHIVMSRILSPEYRLILCANKPFRPGVKLSVTPERSPTRSLCSRRCPTSSLSPSLNTNDGDLVVIMPRKETRGHRGTRHGRVWKRSRLERALTTANWPEKRPRREPNRYGVKEKKVPTSDTTVSCLQPYWRKRKSGCVAPRRFFISSGLATGYNRFDRPIRQVVGGRRRVWNLISRELVGVSCVRPSLFILRSVFMVMKRSMITTLG